MGTFSKELEKIVEHKENVNLKKMIRNNFIFERAENGEWFIILPEYIEAGGNKSDLQMVAGADLFLDALAVGSDSVELQVSDKNFDDAEQLHFVSLGRFDGPEMGTGAWYELKTYKEIEHNFKMWLCSVTLFIFEHKFPDIIYFKKIES
jgi:hypothetical protein